MNSEWSQSVSAALRELNQQRAEASKRRNQEFTRCFQESARAHSRRMQERYHSAYEKGGTIYATEGIELNPLEYRELERLPSILPPGR